MKLLCDWCGEKAAAGPNTVYWELPDGSRVIEITDTPAVTFSGCQMIYQRGEVIKQIEDQLFLVDTKKIGKSLSFEELMGLPRLLKKIILILVSGKLTIKFKSTLMSTLVCFFT